LNYLFGAGPRNVSGLTWGVLAISVIVVVIITGILLFAIFATHKRFASEAFGKRELVLRAGNPIAVIYAGLVLSTLVLFGVTIWTMMTLADIAAPPSKPRITVEVTGHQWWWEVRYIGDDPSQTFTTANEVHIPVGEPVAIKLRSADVIHSFWVPALSGKTDLIPGQTNTTWILADRAGTFRGQCTEYCGLQHAHMGFQVIASPKEKFEAWRRGQVRVASQESGANAGQTVFMQKCAVCHTVRGTRAGGRVGPDLTHLMTRSSIAADTLPNRVGYLSGWIADPQHVKPGSKMPRLDIDGQDLAQVRNYLETLN
jgi:cytochrome c oxidase subunit 2